MAVGATPLALAMEVVAQAMEAQEPMDSRVPGGLAHFHTAATAALGMAAVVRVVMDQASLVVAAVVVLTSPQPPPWQPSLPEVAVVVVVVPPSTRCQEPMEVRDQ